MATAVSPEQTLPAQAVDLSVPHPAGTANLTLPLHQGCEYDAERRTWKIVTAEGFLKFNLNLPATQNVRLTLRSSSTAANGGTDNPYTITVNDYTLIRGFDDHKITLHDVTYVITSAWLRPGHNSIRIELDATARSSVLVQSVSVAGF